MNVMHGHLLIAGITGYPGSDAQPECQHAKEMLDALQLCVIESARPPLRVLKVRDDAVLAFLTADAFVQSQSLLDVIGDSYLSFRRRVETMATSTVCTCRACATIAAWDLTLVVHYGEYAEQDIGGGSPVQGDDFILASCLLNNDVKQTFGITGYALLTEEAVDALGAEDVVSDLSTHHESYERFGEVQVRIWDLPEFWQRERARHGGEIISDDAWICESVELSAAPWTVWDCATDAQRRTTYWDMVSMERVDDNLGRIGEGARFHCVFDGGDVISTITDWDPPRHYVSEEIAFDIPIQFTLQVIPGDEGCVIRVLYGEPEDGDRDELEALFRGAAQRALHRLADMLD